MKQLWTKTHWALPVCILLYLAPAGWAQLPVARLTALFPPGGQRGTTAEVSVSGADLDDADRIEFSHPGLRSAVQEGGKFSITIASNVPPGSYDARVVGRFGISNPRRFVVGTIPESIAPATNVTRSGASPLPVPHTVSGRVAPNGTAWFRLALKKSQRLFIECLAVSIDSRMDATMLLSDEQGRELKRSRTGEVIDFTAPADGAYFLRVADFLYRGGDDYVFRLTASSVPRADVLFPAVAEAGVTTNVTLFGRQLPGGKPSAYAIEDERLQVLTVPIKVGSERRGRLTTTRMLPPAGAALDGFDVVPVKGANPLFVTLATAPVVLEVETNDVPAKAQRIYPPCEVAGQFHPARDVDWFTFEAKKGEVFWVEAVSHRLGWPTDPFVLVQRVARNDRGEEQVSDVLELQDYDTNVGDREFNTATRDPLGRFEAPADGTYRVQIRDLFNLHRSDPRLAYRLAVRHPAPDFRLVVLPVAPKLKDDAKDVPVGVPLLRRGETVALRVMAFRQDGFGGAIDLGLESPPSGLSAVGRIEAGKNSGTLWLTASSTAPGWAGTLRITGRSRIGETSVVHEARAVTLIHGIPSIDDARPRARLAREFAAAVMDRESAPVIVTSSEKGPVEAEAGAKVKIPFTVTRRASFDNKLTLKPAGAGLEAVKAIELDGKATNAVLELDLATLKLGPGTYTFTMQGVTAGKYRNDPEAAELAQAAAKEAARNATEAETDDKKAAETLSQVAKAAGEAEAANKAAMEKLVAARVEVEKAPSDATTAARAAAEKEAEATATRTRSALEARAAATEKKTATEVHLKNAQAKKESTATRAKQLNEKAKPRELTVSVCSEPVRLLIKAPAQAAKK